jgi:hypothetical protein
MIFKQYCAVFFTPTEGLDVEVVKISENDYNKMGGSGISIYTFTSALDVVILTDYFKSLDRNFLIFDLHKESSGFNILDKDKEYLLFGLLNDNKFGKYNILIISNHQVELTHRIRYFNNSSIFVKDPTRTVLIECK